ncbi:P-loop containing nucleoside triphosphate hydrolase protein [Mycena metata]|uniref:P-loop containing nucleoside triphosphate hydrolase protein n=1 Tax=Mycena metata TaxID=1033252 RepID=A0AAD7H9S6_9AGAR|nr:P-loop containing nucleoside triphosphate hydrolase protein [Mycena metata]
MTSDAGADLPLSVVNEITKFTETLYKIHTFVEAQQSGSNFKKFFWQGELKTLLKNCRAGLQAGCAFFQIRTTTDVLADVREMQDQAHLRHQEVLSIIETMSNSDSDSSITQMYSGSYTSSNSLSMLPAEPKIFHGRDSELGHILEIFEQGNPKIAILGAGGMGKTSLARIALHHEKITTKYHGNRFFVACGTASSKVELANLIGAYLGMKPGKDLTQEVLWYFTSAPPSLLILDNLETPWEPVESRKDVEEFLSLLTDITGLALMVTMRGAERPKKVKWTRPFLLPLLPLAQEAARQMFFDITDDRHSINEVDQILDLTNNMPLSISLLAHLVDMESCSQILSRWKTEKTSLISEGYDKRSNLELSISLSLSSPRITSIPHAQDLLALLSILPDGLSDVELKQAEFPLEDILGCKVALLRTALAYTDDSKRVKVLVPVREYMGKFSPPTDQMIQPLFKHFHELVKTYMTAFGKESGAFPIARITSNYTNIQSVLQYNLQPEHSDLRNTIYCTCDFNDFSVRIGHGGTPLLEDITSFLPSIDDHHLKFAFILELLSLSRVHSISHPERLIAQALDHLEHFNDPNIACSIYI